MSKLLITHDDFGCSVWMGLDDEDPTQNANSFVIGCGLSRDAAVAEAVRDLEQALRELQAPAGQIEERT